MSMTKEQEIIERLNRFKTIKVLYGNTLAMHIEQLKTVQEDIETVLSILKEKDEKMEKKNKIMDLMAEYLIGVHIDNYDPTWEHEFEKDNFIILRSKEEVKQYFESKVEEC